MRANVVVVSAVLTSWIVLACTSEEVVGVEEPTIDAGDQDGGAPISPPDASVQEAGYPEIDAGRRPDVTCSQDPCYVAVSGNGGEHVCGLLKDGTVRCWGQDSRARATDLPDGGRVEPDGALGRGKVVSALEGATPAPVVGLADVTQISVGRNLGTCARTSDGAVYCWGRNEFGQLGHTSARHLPVPTRVEGLPPVSFVALGATTGCAIASSDGALHCWGTRGSLLGQLAAPGDSGAFPPQVIPVFRPPVRELAIGTHDEYLGVPFSDTIVTLGEGGVLASLGEFAAGESSAQPMFSSWPRELLGAARIGSFGYVDATGMLSTWIPDRRTLYIPGASSVVDVAISAGFAGPAFQRHLGGHIAQAGVLLSSGRLFRWGFNTGGALGYAPDELEYAEQPIDVTPLVNGGVVSFATTSASTCASLVDGSVKCWGSNLRGELGRGTVDNVPHPEPEIIR